MHTIMLFGLYVHFLDFIKARKVSKAKEVYKELLEKGSVNNNVLNRLLIVVCLYCLGEAVSLETRNQLLALLAYLGTNGDEKISLEMTRERTEESGQ